MSRGCPPCDRICPFRHYPGVARLPSHRQMFRWRDQYLARERRSYELPEERIARLARTATLATLAACGVVLVLIFTF